jgi:dihydropteroate synthase
MPPIVSILNCTPDSFSDGGGANTDERLFAKCDLLLKYSEAIDIGGESTAPGRSAIDSQIEISRITTALNYLANKTTVSVDTYKSKVARFALENGAKIINDVSALRFDPEMVKIICDYQCKIILMHSKETSTPHVTNSEKTYSNLISETSDFFKQRIDFALANGIDKNQIILDPGMGAFLSLDPKYSWELLEKFDLLVNQFKEFPMMIATSRKSFLGGEVLERDPLSQLTALFAVNKGAKYIRTHNPKMMVEFLIANQKCG